MSIFMLNIIFNEFSELGYSYYYTLKYMDNRLNEKSYDKAKTVRKLLRDQMFERNRHLNVTSYLTNYDQRTQLVIKESLEGPLPQNLSQIPIISRETISYFRRCLKPVYKTRMDNESTHDLHMTFESLWGLAAIENIQNYDNCQRVVKQFQDNLPAFLSMPSEIREMAIIAAGNKVLGKQQDILSIAKEDENQLWVLINHIYERKISFTAMYNFLSPNQPIVYRTIYQMSNNLKDEIIESIIKNEEVLQKIFTALFTGKSEVQLYCIRIIGNILAEREDFSEVFLNYQILDRLSMQLQIINQPAQGMGAEEMSFRQSMKKDIFWLFSNYICDTVSANNVLNHEKLLSQIFSLYRTETCLPIKTEICYVIGYLLYYGDRFRIYTLALSQDILSQCCIDMQIESQELTLLILQIIGKLVEIGQEFLDVEKDEMESKRNPFISFIVQSRLKTYIHGKTYNKNMEISNISFEIMDHIEQYQNSQ